MSDLQFIPLGVGDAFSARHYSSCMLVQSQGFRVLVDCPHPIRKMLREATASLPMPVDLGQIDAILISHLHADHCSGLEGAAYFNHFVLDQSVQLYMHPSVSEHLWTGCLGSGMGEEKDQVLKHAVELHDLSFEAPARVGPFTVACRATKHSRPTTAFRLTVGSRSLGVSADTAYDPELIEWLGEADRFVHEANFSDVHTPYEKLAALPDALKRRMWITHYPDEFEQPNSEIELLQQGKTYHV